MTRQREHALRTLQSRKFFVRKHWLAQVPDRIGRHFRHAWAPISALIQHFGLFPDELLLFWADHPAGYVVITPRDGGYEPGVVREGDRELRGVAYIPVASLIGEGPHPLLYIAHLLDHLLGCDAACDGPWLSEGGGHTPEWQEIGRRLYRQFTLGYAATPEARSDPRRYFAEGLVAYWQDRRGLRIQDPGLEAIFRTAILNADFWRRVYRPKGRAKT